MKHFPALALLSLTLAACSQNSTPNAQVTSDLTAQSYAASLPHGDGTTLAALQAAQDAAITSSFDALSTQALAPQVHLYAALIPGTNDQVRGYFKSSFASPVTCSVNWGDGTTATSVGSPTAGRVEAQNHTYGSFNTYTITVTCMDGGAVVGTQSVTVQAGRKSATFDFESPRANANSYINAGVIRSTGFTLNMGSFAPVWSGTQTGARGTTGTQSVDPVSTVNITRDTGGTFTVKGFDYVNFTLNNTGTTTVTGIHPDGTTVTANVTGANTAKHFTFDATWVNIKTLRFTSSGGRTFLDNIDLQ